MADAAVAVAGTVAAAVGTAAEEVPAAAAVEACLELPPL